MLFILLFFISSPPSMATWSSQRRQEWLRLIPHCSGRRDIVRNTLNVLFIVWRGVWRAAQATWWTKVLHKQRDRNIGILYIVLFQRWGPCCESPMLFVNLCTFPEAVGGRCLLRDAIIIIITVAMWMMTQKKQFIYHNALITSFE